jgi:GH25 family lysozyme M1 (1,4-beta-N-acetylmuramidase)
VNKDLKTPWTIWNFTAQAKIPGFQRDADLSVFFGNERQWEDYIGGRTNPAMNAVVGTNIRE